MLFIQNFILFVQPITPDYTLNRIHLSIPLVYKAYERVQVYYVFILSYCLL